MSDIKFSDNETVVVECFTLKTTGPDIVLDNSGRRKNNTANRRAFVHDFNDGITVNWAEDYPGGITLNGPVAVNKLTGTALTLKHWDLVLDNDSRRKSATGSRRALVHDFNDGLTLNWAKDYPGGITMRGDVKCTEKLSISGTDILAAINLLKSKVATLEAKVAVLESKVP